MSSKVLDNLLNSPDIQPGASHKRSKSIHNHQQPIIHPPTLLRENKTRSNLPQTMRNTKFQLNIM